MTKKYEKHGNINNIIIFGEIDFVVFCCIKKRNNRRDLKILPNTYNSIY